MPSRGGRDVDVAIPAAVAVVGMMTLMLKHCWACCPRGPLRGASLPVFRVRTSSRSGRSGRAVAARRHRHRRLPMRKGGRRAGAGPL